MMGAMRKVRMNTGDRLPWLRRKAKRRIMQDFQRQSASYDGIEDYCQKNFKCSLDAAIERFCSNALSVKNGVLGKKKIVGGQKLAVKR